jgi:hypothetical protein
MLKDLVKLVEVLNGKVNPLVVAIEEADPTTKEYNDLLENYAATMNIISTLNRTLHEISLAQKEEGAEDESNN